MICCGLVLASAPFISSLRPNASSLASLPRISLPPLEAGEYAHIPGVLYWGGILVFVDLAGETHLFGTLVYEGKTWVHDYRANIPLYQCEDFGPDFEIEEIYCKSDPYDFARFRLDGTSFTKGQDALRRIPGHRQGDEFVFFRHAYLHSG